MASLSPITAVLGPTNTGKTHLAVERLTAHSSGMIGFPLRLLAREVYDRVCAMKGANRVALITGEEKIEPPDARWYLCTAESMPLDRELGFVALDEAQLGADPERGHVFTDRLLRARGREETMILGSETLRPLVRHLLPEAEIVTRPRFSTLSYAGAKKLSRLPRRSAIVAFSVEEVYAVAEMLRRFAGGAAVVMGALSPSTRNAQVRMFQEGEVDYLVATDAIGMGLNLDVRHVAFASLHKFDGHRRRRLTVPEMAQIAGRAGRHQTDGSFGVLTGKGGEFTPEEIEAIEEHRFKSLEKLYWRESDPRFTNIDTLIGDLEAKPADPVLSAAPEAVDLAVLKRLADIPEVMDAARGTKGLRRLWAAASLPDFRQVGPEHHARFVARLWRHLATGRLPRAQVAQEIARLDDMRGDVEALAQKIAATRTWSYIAHRPDWVEAREEMADRTRELEQKLSDALHDRLRQRFVDRRTSVLLRKMGKDASLLPVSLDERGAVLVDGEEIGTLDGFRFRPAADARASESRLLLAAAERHLGGLMTQKAGELAASDDSEFTLEPNGDGRPAVMWRGGELGVLEPGKTLLQPVFKPAKALNGLEGSDLAAVTARAETWLTARIDKHLGGVTALLTLSQSPHAPGPVRALAIQLAEQGGVAARADVADAVHALDKDQRAAARKAGIVFGALDIYHHLALKPGAARWRSALDAVMTGKPMPELPPESAVHLSDWRFANARDCRNAGYRRFGTEHLRIDLVERLAKKAHEARGQARDFDIDLALPTSLGLSEKGFDMLMRDAGFRRLPPAEPKEEAAEEEAGQEEAQGEKAATEASVNPQPEALPETVEAPDAETQPAESDPAEPPLAEPDAAGAVSTAEAPESAAVQNADSVPEPSEAATSEAAPSDAAPSEAAGETAKPAPAPSYPVLRYRWVGLAKAGRDQDRKGPRRHGKPGDKSKGKGPKGDGPRGGPRGKRHDGPPRDKQPQGALAEQLAALTGRR
ncbi:helicase-related protein [Novosphingopyxis sp. YJ-S2-01]|uniref:helicase-related protein n=1 Tax=Novosphingopyxis sp. YJ-S2-01 TaxID=2794021 RepID=UPI0018DDF96C|nr:helicase-related protein [Novosphingopyxis sp. YJ-S2-01]MBH9537149.1 helicase [Novosphingopyxis sp. YJ-S2-01]